MPLHFISQLKIVSPLLSNSTHGVRGSAGPLRSQGSWIDQCLRSPMPPKGDRMNKNTEATPWLPRRELGGGAGRGKIRGGRPGREPEGSPSAGDTFAAARGGVAGGRDARPHDGEDG